MSMTKASVKFIRNADKVRLALAIDEVTVAEGNDVSLIVREIVARGLTELRLSESYAVHLPTNSATLAEATQECLDEPLAAFILISECAW
jgi:hypothetical protein